MTFNAITQHFSIWLIFKYILCIVLNYIITNVVNFNLLNVIPLRFQPTLIDKGLGSDVTDVRAAALVVIMKISRSAGELLKPHLGVLIPALLVNTFHKYFLSFNMGEFLFKECLIIVIIIIISLSLNVIVIIFQRSGLH